MAYALPALFLLAAKLLLTSACGMVLAARFKVDGLGAWLCAWLAVQASLFFAIYAASVVELLTGYAVIVWLLAAASAAAPQTMAAMRHAAPLGRLSRIELLACAAFAGVVLLLTLRALIFTDNTADAQAYGIVRNAMWMNYRSVLVHMQSPNYPVFTYEWLGELIALPYALVSGNIQGLPFGNVEIAIFCCAALAWLAIQFGAPLWWSLLIGVALVTSPALLGMAAAIKGDLLACGALAFAAAIAIRLARERDSLSAFFLPVGISMAVGAKLTASVCGAALAIVGAIIVLRNRRLIGAMAAGCVLSILLLLRYILNAAVYGSFLMHSEQAVVGFRTFAENVVGIAKQIVRFHAPSLTGGHYNWSLSAGFGYFLCALILVAIMIGLSGPLRRPNADRVVLITLGVAATLALMLFVPLKPWVLRYYLPAILIAAVALIAFPVPRSSLRVGLAAMALCVIAADTVWFMRGGEAWGGLSFRLGLKAALAATPLQRALMAPADVAENFELGVDLDRRERPLTFTVLQQHASPILRIVGSYGQNRLIFAGDQHQLLALSERHNPDFVVFIVQPGYRPSDQLTKGLSAAGYEWFKDGAQGVIARRARGNSVRAPERRLSWRDGSTR